MKSNSFYFGQSKTMDLETKNDDKVFIKIPLDNGRFWQKEYYQNDLIENIIEDFKVENDVEIQDDYFMDLIFKNKSLKKTDKIKSLFNEEVPTIFINQINQKKSIKISNDDIVSELIGKPFSDPFEIFLFFKDDKSLKIQTYDPITVNNLYLNNYSSVSAYCNGNNHLFISGGEKKNGEIIDYFWGIDLKNRNIAEPLKIPPKKNHSMIFIPNNYVFIVGGNDKRTFYFNTQNAEVCEWANLNNIRIEPALQKISNFLYCFDNINKGNNDIFTLEKTDLNSNLPEWILLTPKMNIFGKMDQKFFGVTKDEDNNIIFVGGNTNDCKNNNKIYNYKYNINSNIIEISNVPYRKYNFKEKTFLSYNNNIEYILPDFNKQHPEVVFFVKNKNKIEAIDYEPKLNSHLKSLKPPTSDFKYDFNMPTVAIPDPITDFNFYNQNIQINPEQPNIANIKMNEPSFRDNSFNNNQVEIAEMKSKYINNIGGISLLTSFKEPEIEPTKEDLKLSIDIRKIDEVTKFGNKRNNSNVQKNDNYNHQLTNPEYQMPYYNTEVPFQQKGNINPNFQDNINEPFYKNATKIQKKYILNTTENNISINHRNNLNEMNNLKNNMYGKIDDINMPNETQNIKGSKNSDSSLSGIISAKRDGEKNGHKNSKSFIGYDFKNIDFKKEMNLKGTIHGIKAKDFYLNGIIPGSPKKDRKYDIESPKNKNNVDLREQNNNVYNTNENKIEKTINNQNYYSENINNKNVQNSKHNISKIPRFNKNGSIPGKKKFSQNNLNIKNQKLDDFSDRDENNIKNKKIADYNLIGNIPGIKKSNSKTDISSTKMDKKEFIINGIIPGIKQKNTQYKVIKNDISLDDDIRGKKKVNSKSKKENFYISGIINGTKTKERQLEISNPNIEKKDSKVNSPKSNLTENIINDNSPKKYLKEETKINVPSYNINENISGNNFKGSKNDFKELKNEGSGNIYFEIKNNMNDFKGNLPEIEQKEIDVEDNYNVKEDTIVNELNIPKITMPNMSRNATLKDVINPDYDDEGMNKETYIYNSNKIFNIPNVNIHNYNNKYNADFNLSGEIIENKDIHSNNNINLNTQMFQNSNDKIQTIIENNPVINMPTSQIEIREKYKDISAGNIFKVNNTQNNIPINYSINGNIHGIKDHKSNVNNEDSDIFFISGLIPPPQNNQKQNIMYKTNNVQLSNNNQYEIIPNNFNGNLNNINNKGYQEIKGSRMPLYSSYINNNNDIDDINNQIKLSAQGHKLHNIVVKKMEIIPQENVSNIDNNNNSRNNSPNKQSNIELYPSQIQYNNNICIPDSSVINNINLKPQSSQYQSYNIEYETENNFENKYLYPNSNNNNVFNNEIHIEMPKANIEMNSNYLYEEIPKFNIKNQNNINNIKLNDLNVKVIEEEKNKDGNFEEKFYYGRNVGCNRANSRKKNKDLPLVSMKNNEFKKSSKIGVVGQLNTENIDINNIKSTNVGVNGIKIGDRIIE